MSGLIVHEWIEKNGGAEKVVDCMADMHPSADIFCLWNDDPRRYQQQRVTESWIARSRLRSSKALALPMMPTLWRHVDVSNYDWVLVSSHLFAHHVGRSLADRQTKVFAYVHTPARYIWEPQHDQRGKNPIVRAIAPFYRRTDRRRAGDGVRFAANSSFVQDRIRRTWGQPSEVIPPPVAIDKLQNQPSWADLLDDEDLRIYEGLPTEFILGASRFVPYKLLESVILLGQKARIPVVIAGSGPQEKALRDVAHQVSVPVSFVDRPSNNLLYALYQRAAAYVFPPVEDFGIMPVEAMALGTPVLVNSQGGAGEAVKRLRGGRAVERFDDDKAVKALSDVVATDMSEARAAAKYYSDENFKLRVEKWTGVAGDPRPRTEFKKGAGSNHVAAE